MNRYTLSDFDYDLPDELVAQSPAEPRDTSKLMVLDRKSGSIKHHTFYEIVNYLKPGDVLVVNDTKVFPARLFGYKTKSQGRVEIFLLNEIKPGLWEVIGRGLKVGSKIEFENSGLIAEVEEKNENIYIVNFNMVGELFFAELENIGLTPLPPYIHRDKKNQSDKNNYQTVYAKDRGSVAAPTAGLHFTKDLLKKIEQMGVVIASVTLHVGLGTFSPIKTQKIEDHKMHSEYYSISEETYNKIESAKKNNNRIIAVGTTSNRVLETVFSKKEIEKKDLSGVTDIFIYPGYEFRCIDGLITNFHIPKSSLLMLVSAFAGKDSIDNAYRKAIEHKYRFYSYGDAMLII